MIDTSKLFDLSGKVIVVTGAGSGIGLAFSRGFAGSGAEVICADRDVGRANEAADAIKAAGGRAIPSELDVADATSVQAFADQLRASHQRIDVLVNNAGVSSLAVRTHELAIEEWDRLSAINLRGVFLCSRAILPMMLAHGGSIINIASIMGLASDSVRRRLDRHLEHDSRDKKRALPPTENLQVKRILASLPGIVLSAVMLLPSIASSQSTELKVLNTFDGRYPATPLVLDKYVDALKQGSAGRLAFRMSGPEVVPAPEQFQPVQKGAFDMLFTVQPWHINVSSASMGIYALGDLVVEEGRKAELAGHKALDDRLGQELIALAEKGMKETTVDKAKFDAAREAYNQGAWTLAFNSKAGGEQAKQFYEFLKTKGLTR